MLNIPPGFSIDVPPGFTKAHCKLQIEAAAVSYADAPSSLILDAPPGYFTRISLLALLKLIADYLLQFLLLDQKPLLLPAALKISPSLGSLQMFYLLLIRPQRTEYYILWHLVHLQGEKLGKQMKWKSCTMRYKLLLCS